MSITGLNIRRRLRRRFVRLLDRGIALLDPAAGPSTRARPTVDPPSPTAPISPSTASASASTAPASASTAPASPSTAPASASTAPASASTAPASPATAPASPSTASASASTAPASASTAPASASTAPVSASTAPASPSTASASASTAAPPLKPLPGLPAPEPRAARAAEPVSDKPSEAAKPSPAERQARHWERTRKGLLRFIHERGGSATLHELHEHSESTYFVAHVSFSRMMEELTGGGQLSYDHDTATATLTEAGRAEL